MQNENEQTRMRRGALRSPDSSTAFRLSKGLLATIDAMCEQEDLTRSQLYRRSISEYLKRHNADNKIEVTSAEPNSFFESWREGVTEAHAGSAAS